MTLTKNSKLKFKATGIIATIRPVGDTYRLWTANDGAWYPLKCWVENMISEGKAELV